MKQTHLFSTSLTKIWPVPRRLIITLTRAPLPSHLAQHSSLFGRLGAQRSQRRSARGRSSFEYSYSGHPSERKGGRTTHLRFDSGETSEFRCGKDRHHAESLWAHLVIREICHVATGGHESTRRDPNFSQEPQQFRTVSYAVACRLEMQIFPLEVIRGLTFLLRKVPLDSRQVSHLRIRIQ